MGPYRHTQVSHRSTQKDSKLGDSYPSTAQSVQIRATDTTVGDLDVDIGLLPGLGLKLLPDHLAIGSLLVQAHPALELVVG